MNSAGENPPLICFEDEHILVINKPAGLNTHSPSPYAGEGVFEWLRNREPRWATLAIIHRLDKETSGLMVFAKTPAANRSLTEQFAQRRVHKSYQLVTDRRVPERAFTVVSDIRRAGDRYTSSRGQGTGQRAETEFRVVEVRGNQTIVQANPKTGRTHQIRVHASENGFPILGDKLYGGTPAPRLFLHSEELRFAHPETGSQISFRAAADFASDPRMALRGALIDSRDTNACRLVHGAADGQAGWYVDRFGEFLLSQSAETPSADREQHLQDVLMRPPIVGAYQKLLTRTVSAAPVEELSPIHLFGATAPERFSIRENGLQFEISFREGYSVGLFLDQRDNRRRFLVNYIAPNFPIFVKEPSQCAVLNTFAYTCGFSVCAAKAGARTTSIDLSTKYLQWGRRNFELNNLNVQGHDFIYGDVFDWLRRLSKKSRLYDVIILDPPTASRSKESGLFRVEKVYGKLVAATLPLLARNGVLLACANAAQLEPEKFLSQIRQPIASKGRRIVQEHYVPQPPDFPISRDEPAYLKTVWLRVG